MVYLTQIQRDFSYACRQELEDYYNSPEFDVICKPLVTTNNALCYSVYLHRGKSPTLVAQYVRSYETYVLKVTEYGAFYSGKISSTTSHHISRFFVEACKFRWTKKELKLVELKNEI